MGLRSIATLDAAGNDAAKKIALQNTFHKQAKSLATTLTELRLASDLGCANALRVAAPAVKYDMLTEEQKKVLEDLQKEQVVTQKTEANKNRAHPYDEGGVGRSLIFKGECRLCGVQGHWPKDKMFKAVNIQRKGARDASMQYQQQWAASGSYSGQPMQQYGYGAPARLAPSAVGYAGPSGMGGGGQQGGVAGQQMGLGGGATPALTHHNQAPAGGT